MMRLLRCPPIRCLFFGTLVISLFGCNTGTRYPRLDAYSNMGQPSGPNSSPAALLQKERNQAVRYDPYPDNDIGPEIDGGRPRDYSQQLPETVRGRWTQ